MFCGKELEGRAELQWSWGQGLPVQRRGPYLPALNLRNLPRCPMMGRQATAGPHVYPAWPAQECAPIPRLTTGLEGVMVIIPL